MNNKYVPFEQREGGDATPMQLSRTEISPALRAAVWSAIRGQAIGGSPGHEYVVPTWRTRIRHKWVYRDHRMIDDFPEYDYIVVRELRKEFESADYKHFYGTIEYFIQLTGGADRRTLVDSVAGALAHARSPYRVFDYEILVPISSDQDAITYQAALVAAAKSNMDGARAHLRAAGSLLSDGSWAQSIRESISAVESVAIMLAPGSKELGPALKELERSGYLHGAMKNGFLALYGYTSDEKGIRHALLEESAKADEFDALFMLSACSAFVTFLINRGRSGGLLKA